MLVERDVVEEFLYPFVLWGGWSPRAEVVLLEQLVLQQDFFCEKGLQAGVFFCEKAGGGDRGGRCLCSM